MERFLTTLPIHSTENSYFDSSTDINNQELFILSSAKHSLLFDDVDSDKTLANMSTNSIILTSSNQLAVRTNVGTNISFYNLSPDFFYFFKPFEYLTNSSIMTNTLNISDYFDANKPNIEIDSAISETSS